MTRYTVLLLPLILGASGCEALYDIQQDRAQDDCNRLVQMDERAACLRRNQTSYDQYERDRQKLRRGHSEKDPA